MLNSSILYFGKLCSRHISCLCFQPARCIRANVKAPRVTRTKKFTPPNPGLENRLQILREENPDVEELDGEDIDGLESEFMEVGNMHKDYLREKKASADALAYSITKKAYFKPPKLPNLLTWNEKEQIRNLHQLDPKEWDPENLARGFPASPEVIKKVIKAKWKPLKESDIKRHDRSVQRNWEALLAGKFNLDINLRCHLLSFSSRRQLMSTEDSPVNDKKIVVHNRPKGSTEFSDIVDKKRRPYDIDEEGSAKDPNLVVNIPDFVSKYVNSKSSDPRSDSFVVPGKSLFSRKLMPLEDFKEKLISSMSKQDEDGDELSKKYYEYLTKGNSCENIVPAVNEESLPETKKLSSSMNKLEKYKKVAVDNLLPKQLDAFKKAEQYKLKIKIPKGKHEETDLSVMYKVNDCFYDTDGKFLYRVPGMS